MVDIKVRVNRNKCCYCGACVSVCPVPEGALELEETMVCPVGALSMTKKFVAPMV